MLPQPSLWFCSIIRSATSNENLNRLFILQKQDSRLNVLAGSRDHTSPSFHELKLWYSVDLVRDNVGCFSYKAFNHRLPCTLFTNCFLHQQWNSHSYGTRNSNHIHHYLSLKTLIDTEYEHMPLKSEILSNHGANTWADCTDSSSMLELNIQRLQFSSLFKKKISQQYKMGY